MSTKSIIISGIVFLGLIIGMSFLLTTGQKPEPAKVVYSAQASEKPIAQTSETSADFGEMKDSDTKQKDFTLENAGTKPLQILNVNSSCNCTFGQIIYNGTTSKEFGMHAQSGYVTDIAPGSSATVRVIYRPYIMPVVGPVEREVYVTTNDPQKETVTFSIKATLK